MKKLLNPSQILSRISSGCVVCVALILGGCGGNASVSPVTLSSIAVNPDPVFIGAGTTLGLTAKGIYSDGTTADFSSRVVWASADQSVASVSSAGVLTAILSTGSTTITAAWSGVTSHAVRVTITAAASTPTKELGTARYDHTATLLPDGTVLVAGGYDASGALYSSELYDPGTGLWSPTASGLNIKRGDHTAVLLNNGLALAVGGADGISGTVTNPTSAELYDPATKSWRLTSSLLMGRSYHSITLLADGRVLVVGGENPTAPAYLNSAEIYDPAAESPSGFWIATTGNLTTGRNSHTATLLKNGKVLVAGGFTILPGQTAGTALISVELYDPVADTWSQTGPLSKGRFAHTATLLTTGPNAGKVLVVGGSDAAGNDVASAEIYDPNSGTWTPTGGLGIARYNHLATLMPSGQVLVLGGSNANDTFLSSAELYDPVAGTWSGTANLQTGRVVFTATLLANGTPSTNGKVLVVGGDGAAGTLSSVELHD